MSGSTRTDLSRRVEDTDATLCAPEIEAQLAVLTKKGIREASPATMVLGFGDARGVELAEEAKQSIIEGVLMEPWDASRLPEALSAIRLTIAEAALAADAMAMFTDVPIAPGKFHSPIATDEAYKVFEAGYKHLMHRNVASGVHLNFNVADGDVAVEVRNRFLAFEPFFIALGAGSPFVERRDIGAASGRHLVFNRFPPAIDIGYCESLEEYRQVENEIVPLLPLEKIDPKNHPRYTYPSIRIPNKSEFGFRIECRMLGNCITAPHLLFAGALMGGVLRRIILDIRNGAPAPPRLRSEALGVARKAAIEYGMESVYDPFNPSKLRDGWDVASKVLRYAAPGLKDQGVPPQEVATMIGAIKRYGESYAVIRNMYAEVAASGISPKGKTIDPIRFGQGNQPMPNQWARDLALRVLAQNYLGDPGVAELSWASQVLTPPSLANQMREIIVAEVAKAKESSDLTLGLG